MNDTLRETKNAKYRDIYITSQEGVHPLINEMAVEAISELMSAFPEYKENYPITNIGNWKSNDSSISLIDYRRLSENEQSLHIQQANGRFLKPFESVDWYTQFGKYAALQDGRNTQLNATTIMSAMQNDPTHEKIPQFQIMILKDDIYPNKNYNYIYGFGAEGVGLIISSQRFKDSEGYFDNEGFKTIVMHEFGHVIGLTKTGRDNTIEEGGAHCLDELCLMQQRMSGDFSDITRARLALKANDLPPICTDCVKEGEKFFAKEREKKLYEITARKLLQEARTRRF